MMKKFTVLTCCLLLAVTTMAKVYKVNNPDEFKKATDIALAGDEIVIANGTYTNWVQVINTNGTFAKPVIIRAETATKVVFTGEVTKPVFQLKGSYTEISGITFTACNVSKPGVLVDLNSSNCRLTNCVFTKNVAKTQFLPIVVVSGKGERNRVDHCSFISNAENQEVQIKITATEVPQYTLVDNNLFKDKAKVTWSVFNGGECVQVGQDPVMLGTQVANSIIRNNKFIHCDGEAEVISNKSSGNKYIANTFEDCKGELVMRGGHDCLIDSNTIKGGSGGIRVNGTHHTITNNILSGLPTGIRLMYGMAKGKTEIGFYIAAADCTIKANHIANCQTAILIGDSKGVDWTGKFDTNKYPSRVMQDVPPSNNIIENNSIKDCKVEVLHNEN